MQLSTEAIIGLIGAGATLLVGIVTWHFASAHARRSIATLRMAYRINVEPLLPNQMSDKSDLEIEYRGEPLLDPHLMSIEISNSGNTAIEDPPINVSVPGVTYVDLPPILHPVRSRESAVVRR